MQAMVATMAGYTFTTEFTLADNSTVTLDAQGMLALSGAVQAHAEACRIRARTLRTLIFAEGITDDELAAIDIEAGWPSNT